MTALLTVRTHKDQDADQRLAARIKHQLASDSRAHVRLQIEVDGGVVTLRGVATSFYQKQLWLHGTKRAVGDGTMITDEVTVIANGDDSDLNYRE